MSAKRNSSENEVKKNKIAKIKKLKKIWAVLRIMKAKVF